MKKRYFRLNDTSGTYWSGALNLSFKRDVPVEHEGGPDIKLLLSRKVIVEIDKNEYHELCAKHGIKVCCQDHSGEIVQPVAQDEATHTINTPQHDSASENGSELKSSEAGQEEPDSATQANEDTPGESSSPGADPEPPTEEELTDILAKAIEREIVTVKRGWLKFGDVTLGQGITPSVEKLMDNTTLAIQIVKELGLSTE